jgi:hypothetical protein
VFGSNRLIDAGQCGALRCILQLISEFRRSLPERTLHVPKCAITTRLTHLPDEFGNTRLQRVRTLLFAAQSAVTTATVTPMFSKN